MPFQKGKSGNPGGRPVKDERLRMIEDMAREHSEKALKALLDEANTGKGAPRVAAAIAILDRGWGKAVERKEEGSPGAFSQDKEELMQRIKVRMVRLGLAKVVSITDARKKEA